MKAELRIKCTFSDKKELEQQLADSLKKGKLLLNQQAHIQGLGDDFDLAATLIEHGEFTIEIVSIDLTKNPPSRTGIRIPFEPDSIKS